MTSDQIKIMQALLVNINNLFDIVQRLQERVLALEIKSLKEDVK